MINNRLPEFNQVTAGRTSQLKIPKYALTLKGLELRLGGTTFTKALISEVRMKIGTAVRSAISGAQLDLVNSYRGIASDALHLPLDFSEATFKDIVAEEIGGWDLTKISDDVYLEVDISSSASSPTMYALAWFTSPQGGRTVNGQPSAQPIQKYVRANYQAPATGGARNALPFDPKGALIKRIYMQYAAGSDWTVAANGNFSKLEVKKNGGVVWELECLDARYEQVRYKHVPQSRLYVVDFVIDNNLSGALRTADAAALEFNAFVTAAETQVTAIFDVLDLPYNL